MSHILFRTSSAIQLTFRCRFCGQLDLFDKPDAAPVCCNQPMGIIRGGTVGGDPARIRMFLLKLEKGATAHGFSMTDRPWPEDWNPAYELWRFGIGRIKGERVGWLGGVTSDILNPYDSQPIITTWAFIMVPGCSPADGFASSKEAAFAKMWDIINAY